MPHLELSLAQNYPNPFNPATTIRYVLPKKVHMRLEIFDSAGRRIMRLVDDDQDAGPHSAQWNGKDAAGVGLSSGIYFYRITAGKETISKKMVLLR